MDRLPREIVHIITRSLGYWDYLEFCVTSKNIRKIITFLDFEMRLTLSDPVGYGILRSDITFLDFLYRRGFVEHFKMHTVVTAGMLGFVLRKETPFDPFIGKVSYLVYKWFKNREFPISHLTLRDTELVKYFTQNPVTKRDFSSLLREGRYRLVRNIVEIGLVPNSDISTEDLELYKQFYIVEKK